MSQEILDAGHPLPRDFYVQPTLEVARKLLGQMLVRTGPDGQTLAGMIVETEAYAAGDPALYAYQTLTPRSRTMFGPPGFTYLYATYRVHLMLNIVCAPEGVAESILVRALEPVRGQDVMQRNRRGISDIRQLTNGPGKLTAALGLTVADFNAINVTLPGSPLQIVAHTFPACQIVTTTRIGLSRGAELPWRFYIAGNPFVSRLAPANALNQPSSWE